MSKGQQQAPREINFTKYDVLGFDMDFTLSRYELVPFFTMAYDKLCKYLVDVKHYDASIFHDLAEDRDLVYKGLVVHFAKGNILKIAYDGTILRASHGTKKMTESEIVSAYGEDKLFPDYQNIQNGMKKKDLCWRLFENYFDIPGVVALAKIIDFKEQMGLQLKSEDFLQIFGDVFSGLEYMYTPSNFAADKGDYFPEMKANTSKYIDRISSEIKSWLTDLRKDGRILFLLTSSFPDFAALIMETAFGKGWKSFFDICLYGARKPVFFTDSKPFIELDGVQFVKEVETLKQGVEYSSGNHKTLMSFLMELTGKSEPKVLYFGDNLSADAWPSTQLASWDCVLVLEEMDAEGYVVSDGTVPGHDDEMEDPSLPPAKRKRFFEHSSLITAEETELMVSKCWGSTFIDDCTGSSANSTSDKESTDGLKMNTMLGCLISQCSTICVPSIEYLAGIPVDHSFTTFSSEVGNTLGFHPGRPRSLLPTV